MRREEAGQHQGDGCNEVPPSQSLNPSSPQREQQHDATPLISPMRTPPGAGTRGFEPNRETGAAASRAEPVPSFPPPSSPSTGENPAARTSSNTGIPALHEENTAARAGVPTRNSAACEPCFLESAPATGTQQRRPAARQGEPPSRRQTGRTARKSYAAPLAAILERYT